MKNKTSRNIPCLELPTRCYLSASNQGVRISCTPKGEIRTSKNRQAFEEWYMLKDEQSGCVQFQNCAHGYVLVSNSRNENHVGARKLSSSSDGNGNYEDGNEDALEESLWTIKKSSDNRSFSLCGVRSGRHLTCDENGELSAVVSGDDGDKSNNGGCDVTTWYVEYLTGELCFISSPSCENKKVSCHPWDGKLKMSDNLNGWEVWRFIEAGDGHVRIMSWHDNHILCSNQDGDVFTTDNLQGDWEKWEVDLGPDGANGVVFKSVSHGKYLQLGADKILRTRGHLNSSSSIFHITAANQQNFYVSSLTHDKRITCGKDRIYSSKNRKGWEVWNLKFCEKGCIRLRSEAHDMYLGSDQNGKLYQSSNADNNSLWEIQISATNSILLKSKKSGRFLSCDEEGNNFSTRSTSDPGISEVFCLEPTLPSTKTGAQLRNLTIGGSVAALSIIAAPIAVVGMIGAMGFGGGGIAASSVAAGMMSAEAAASGGIIAAGGTVATLQSIGAAGLGIAGTTASMSMGAVVGASALGVSAAASKKHPSKGETATIDAQVVINRPFCDWQSW